MAKVSKGGKEDVDMTKVGESKGTRKDNVEMARSEARQDTEADVEMAEVTLRSEPELSTIAQPDKGKGQAAPAIIVEPPTLVKGLADLSSDIGPSPLQGNHQI